MKKYQSVILICSGMVVFLSLVLTTIVLYIKVNRLEKSMKPQIVTEAGRLDMNQYLEDKYVEVKKNVDPTWEKWEDVRYNYGFDKEEQPIFNTINGVLETDTMISVRGGKGRWNHRFVSGGHVFEGWSGQELSRLTLIMGKFHETFGCIQTYSPAGLYEEERRFGWVKIGSDEKKKGVDFSQGWSNFYTPLTLQRRTKAPDQVTDSDLNPQLSSAKVPVGTMYYDVTFDRVRVMTKTGWKELKFE